MIKIEENLYQGDIQDAIEASLTKTVDVIVYLGQELPKPLSHISQVSIVHLPLKDGHNEALKFEILLMNMGHLTVDNKTMVACRAGISRSPSAIVAFLTAYKGWEFDTATEYVRRIIPQFQPEPHFLQDLKVVTEDLKEFMEKRI